MTDGHSEGLEVTKPVSLTVQLTCGQHPCSRPKMSLEKEFLEVELLDWRTYVFVIYYVLLNFTPKGL